MQTCVTSIIQPQSLSCLSKSAAVTISDTKHSSLFVRSIGSTESSATPADATAADAHSERHSEAPASLQSASKPTFAERFHTTVDSNTGAPSTPFKATVQWPQ